MTDHPDPATLAYVTAAAPLVGLELSPARLRDLATAFAMVKRIGAPALDFSLDAEDEPAPVFTP